MFRLDAPQLAPKICTEGASVPPVSELLVKSDLLDGKEALYKPNVLNVGSSANSITDDMRNENLVQLDSNGVEQDIIFKQGYENSIQENLDGTFTVKSQLIDGTDVSETEYDAGTKFNVHVEGSDLKINTNIVIGENVQIGTMDGVSCALDNKGSIDSATFTGFNSVKNFNSLDSLTCGNLDDSVENFGQMNSVMLGDGNDSYNQKEGDSSAIRVDAGSGTDVVLIDSASGQDYDPNVFTNTELEFGYQNSPDFKLVALGDTVSKEVDYFVNYKNGNATVDFRDNTEGSSGTVVSGLSVYADQVGISQDGVSSETFLPQTPEGPNELGNSNSRVWVSNYDSGEAPDSYRPTKLGFLEGVPDPLGNTPDNYYSFAIELDTGNKLYFGNDVNYEDARKTAYLYQEMMLNLPPEQQEKLSNLDFFLNNLSGEEGRGGYVINDGGNPFIAGSVSYGWDQEQFVHHEMGHALCYGIKDETLQIGDRSQSTDSWLNEAYARESTDTDAFANRGYGASQAEYRSGCMTSYYNTAMLDEESRSRSELAASDPMAFVTISYYQDPTARAKINSLNQFYNSMKDTGVSFNPDNDEVIDIYAKMCSGEISSEDAVAQLGELFGTPAP